MSGTITRGQKTATFLRSSDLAARVFAPGSGQPESRFVYAVAFRGTLAGRPFMFEGTDGAIAVKSFSKPDVEIETEELNQYNKKRLAVKGIKYKPMTMVLYDRPDSLGDFLRAYLKHYIGDFSQPKGSWAYDVIHAEMISASEKGFGFGSVPDTPDEQFILDEIVIMRGLSSRDDPNLQSPTSQRDVMRLIRPRITEIDFDDMDYESSDPVMITLSIMFEALIMEAPEDHRDEQQLAKALDGRVLDLPNDKERLPFSAKKAPPSNSIFGGRSALTGFGGSGWRANSGGVGGVLGTFGGFDFGRLAGSLVTRTVTGAGTRGLGAELAYTATSNPVLATLLNSRSSRTPLTDIGAAVLGSVQGPTTGLASVAWDLGFAGLSGAGRSPRSRAGYVTGDLVSGVLASRSLGGNPFNAPVRNGRAVGLTAQDYAVINAKSSGMAQYGFNKRAAADDVITREDLPPPPP